MGIKLTGNPHIIKDGVCTLFLLDRAGKVKAKTIVDEDDAERVLKRRWLVGRNGYAITVVNGKQIGLHNFIMKSQMIDHISGNRFDNRKRNLRKVTSQQNAQNVAIGKQNTSGLKGVSWDKRLGKWCVFIQIPGMKIKRVWATDDKNNAGYIYDQWAMQLFGEFARTNFNYSGSVVVPRQDKKDTPE